MAFLSRFHSGSDAARHFWPGQRVTIQATLSACSSNEKCFAVNEINTDIRLAQQELRGKERARGKKEMGWRVRQRI